MRRIPSVFRLAALLASGLTLATSSGPAQVSGWPDNAPPFLQGPTPAATIQNGVRACSAQCRVVAQAASEMARRAQSAAYLPQNFSTDYQNLQNQFQNLQATFAAVSAIVSQIQSAGAANAAAELDSGLTIIAEAFAPMNQDMQSGTMNRDTIVRCCQVLREALNLWGQELTKNSARLAARP